MAFTLKHLNGGNPPVHMHGGNHIIDPAKKKAEAQANKNLNTSERVYEGGSRNLVNNPDGTRTLTSTRNYTQKGTGKAGKTYKQLKAEGGDVRAARLFNAEQAKRGVETESITSVNLKPYGIVQPKTNITGDTQGKITLPKQEKEKIVTKKKKKKKKNYIVQDTGRAIGDAGRSVAEGVGNAVSNLGYAFSRRGVVGSLFNCRTCGR